MEQLHAVRPILAERASMGISGLDDILGGGLPKDHLYLIQGKPGTGKTTLALQFLLEGSRKSEKVLYITFSETKAELDAVAESHGWDISEISILELSAISSQVGSSTQTLFHPAEVELSQTIAMLLDKIRSVEFIR